MNRPFAALLYAVFRPVRELKLEKAEIKRADYWNSINQAA